MQTRKNKMFNMVNIITVKHQYASIVTVSKLARFMFTWLYKSSILCLIFVCYPLISNIKFNLLIRENTSEPMKTIKKNIKPVLQTGQMEFKDRSLKVRTSAQILTI